MNRAVSFDWWVFLLGFALSMSGLLYIYSAAWQPPDPPGPYFSTFFIKQFIFLILSIVAFNLLRRINWGLKPGSWLWFYIPVVFLLVLVLLIGHGPTPGVHRWISLGLIDVQPSEFAKLAFIMVLAWLYSVETSRELKHNYIVVLGVMASLLALVIIQPDLGTAMVFVFIFFVMSMFAPLPRRWLLFTMLGFVLLAIPGWFMLKDYQKARIVSFLNPESDPGDTGYHLRQSKIAVGSGGWTGKGFLRGTQTRGNFIPEIHNDFIFALVAEEYGFLGCVWLLLLYFLLLARILAISLALKTPYERYFCYGTSALIMFHVFVAAGMTIGLTPITGLPLPFVSYGGSSLMTMWLLLAINESLYASSRRDFHRSRWRT